MGLVAAWFEDLFPVLAAPDGASHFGINAATLLQLLPQPDFVGLALLDFAAWEFP